MSARDGGGGIGGVGTLGRRRRFEDSEFTVRIYPGTLAEGTIYCPVSARKTTTAAEAIERVIERLRLDRTKCYVLAEVKEFGGEEWILNPTDCPVQRMMLWPRVALEQRSFSGGEDYRFLLRQKNLDGSIHYGGSLQMWLRVTEERRCMVERGLLPQPEPQGDHADLCRLPELNERSLLDNLRSRFRQEKIYTYVGSILIVINPFQFLPIYNPKYVKMYDNHALGEMEPHIYAVADVAYHAMLQRRSNQCIVISGESGSGKTQSTNFLIHHLTALSQKGFASGVEQIILGAGPVLEAFGNAKTAHNNNSSRFGKFIQVNYQESGTVRGAYVEKYLLEKSRLVYQEHNERNYHVFYYLLAGASEEERTAFHLKKPEEYHYLNQDCFTVEGEDLKHDFERLQLAMEMVGFLPATRKQIFSLLSAILHLGNIRYKKKTYRDDSIDICNPEVLPIVSELLEVKEEMLFEALTTRKTVTVGERLIVPYKLAEAGTVRDSMSKSLYSALFDWIVFRINHALLNNRDLEDTAKILSIGVLDIFGFEDYENNSFEQFCINFANERLQHYFNQHIFKLEQEEYRSEGISWHNIDYIDNTGCINLISKKPTALLHLLDEECNFPQATNQTLLDKFRRQHEGNSYIEFPAVMEPAFIIRHYAGKVKYGVKDFREKNTDHMRPDIVALLKSSKNAFICGLIGIDPPATFRWAVLRAYFRAMVAFREAGKRHTQRKSGHDAAAPCAALNSVDSFSFLHHPVHQRSLEILQRCKEEKHSVARKNPRTPLSDLQGSNMLNEKAPRESPSLGWNGRGGRQSHLSCSSSNAGEDGGIFVNSTSSKLLERAHGILMRNKNYKLKPTLPKHLLDVKSLKYLSNLTLHDRITKSLLHLHKKKKPPSISAQFQASLNKLMETLGQSEPYFVKCIRSNAEKLPLRFNDSLVLRQLRYTGMLETVRIRQSGYSIKYTFEDFVRHFRVLLPEGTSASQEGIRHYLRQADLAPDGFQVGRSMVFLRGADRQRLQARLHEEVLRHIVTLQRRFRARLERKNFVRMRHAAVQIQQWWRNNQSKDEEEEDEEDYDPAVQEGAALCLQTAWRGFRERRRLGLWRGAALLLQREWRRWLWRRMAAALVIQMAWRRHRAKEAYLKLRGAVALLQVASRGYLARQSFRELKEQKQKERLLLQQEEQLQNGQTSLSPEREEEEDEEPTSIMGLDLSTWEDRSYEERERSLQKLSAQEGPVEDKQQDEAAGTRRAGAGGETRSSESSSRAHSEPPGSTTTPPVVVRERTRTLDEPSQKTTRAKRESRRMRELEQAKFSLELLKVRATSGGASSPSDERRWSAELVPPTTPPLRSPQGTPDSQSSKGSFELLSMDEEPPKEKPEVMDAEEPGTLFPTVLAQEMELPAEVFSTFPKMVDEPSRASVPEVIPPPDSQARPAFADPSPTPPPKIENYLPIFYVPVHEGISVTACPPGEELSQPLNPPTSTTTTAVLTKPPKERRESSRRPVVVVISMQKETPLSEDLLGMVRPPVELRDEAAQTGELTPSPQQPGPVPPPQDPLLVPAPAPVPTAVPAANQAVLEKLERLNEEKEERQRHQQQQNEREMMEQIRKQKEELERQRRYFAQYEKDMLEKQRGEALQRIQQSRQGGTIPGYDVSGPGSRSGSGAGSASRPLRPSSLLIERAPSLGPSSRTQSVSEAPSEGSSARGNIQTAGAQARLPPPPTSGREKRPGPEGWAPRLILESRDSAGGEAGARERVPKKAPTNQVVSASMTDRSGKIFFSPKDKVSFSKFDKDTADQERPATAPKDGPPSSSKPSKTLKTREVGRAGYKKKARMARTRSDFLTRAPILSVGGESEEDDGDNTPLSPRHYTLPLPKQVSPHSVLGESCFSDSEMPSVGSEEKKKMQKAMSSGDLGKVDLMPKNSQTDGRVRGKMRFWGKTKQGEKKPSREKLICGADSMDGDYGDTGPLLGEGQEHMSPPRSPDLTLERAGREFKENKEPSPKVKRRRSVKISNVALEPAQWQNDSLQILTCANDYKSMNDFLMKKINDLDTEDSKKDTMVDVVFKKALKEFRLNIFNSYSTALAMDDGKSIRYKDLYALFEHILEKTMRQEQRDWRESPVKVWVNTFKVFLDEFMTEYKPLDPILSKVPKTERKKRRKKDMDIVEEHNGHIFKSTQYSIPTYCEYCSSLIWMMDRACVCKLCRYACHRKCCLKMTTKCSKKYDPELSSRQFGVEVSRLTNDERTVPLVVEKLINYIEMHGLYTEGIYRKSGSTNKIKELKQGLDTDVDSMNLDDYNIHVIGSVFKQWLRDLPNPLMTFELYEEFLRAMCLQDKKEVIRGVYSIIDQLSRTHLNTLERLIFHLVRIALQEETNRMSANALAIVFAPCILRCPDTIDPLQSVQDIGKTTACVELIIVEQMNKYRARLKDINSLEFAENKAKCRLTLIRRSMKPVMIAVRFMSIARSAVPGKGHMRRLSYHTPSPPVSPRLPPVTDAGMEDNTGEEGAGLEPEVSEHQQAVMQHEERVLTEQIERLEKEKEELTFEMLSLEPRASDDETLESEASIGTADSSENVNLDSEGGTSDFSERGPAQATTRPKKSEGKSQRRRALHRQPDSLDSVDSCSTVSSLSSSSHLHPSSSSSSTTARRFRFRSKSPSSGSSSAQGPCLAQCPRHDSLDFAPTSLDQEGLYEERPQFTSRGTFNPEKGKQKLKGAKPSTLRHSRDGGGHSRDPPDIPQQLVLYGSNEFMV
ncbi:unconventional myosin-IXAa isoform X3 [Hypomesus transpacificus]|uniref:unconventional myosin-IXAa isoform X3 n=1 Tax=Hypomesus transpacificus TaxID=137520 RepID=UPI001F087FEE|nr:unconventional myosin-IXAa isoform X3 [Hypomesus transpacificus]